MVIPKYDIDIRLKKTAFLLTAIIYIYQLLYIRHRRKYRERKKIYDKTNLTKNANKLGEQQNDNCPHNSLPHQLN